MSLIKPFKGNFTISQDFGNKLIIDGKDYYAKYGLLGHDGIDYRTPTGTPILAPHDGVIIENRCDPDGYGNYIKIENDTEGSVLGHLQETMPNAKLGFTVKQGDIIALSDNTGASTGPHLHWGYYRKPRNRANGYDGYIDLTPYLAAIGGINMTEPQQPIPSADYIATLEKDRMDFWKQRDEALAKVADLQKQLDELNKKFTDNFTYLGQVQDLGFPNIDELKKVVEPYREMYLAGYPNLESIKARIAGIQLQAEDKDTTITKQQTQITDLQQAVLKAQEVSAPLLLENTDLKTKIADYEKRLPLLNPKSVINYIAQLLELLKKLKPNNKLVQQADNLVDEIKPEQVDAAVTAWNELSTTIKANN